MRGHARGPRSIGGRAVSAASRRCDRPCRQPARRRRARGAGGDGADVGGRRREPVGGRVRPQGSRARPPDLPRWRPTPPRDVAVTSAPCHTQLSLDPEADARFSAALDVAVAAERAKSDDGRTFDQLRADAFMALVTARTAPGTQRPAELLIPLRSAHDAGRFARHRRVRDVRRPTAPAGDRPPVGLQSEHHPDRPRRRRQGDRRRPSQTVGERRSTTSTARHAPPCAAPDCPVRFGDCDIYHLEEWREDGATDLVNLIPLCSRHHHPIHEGQWRPPARAPAA